MIGWSRVSYYWETVQVVDHYRQAGIIDMMTKQKKQKETLTMQQLGGRALVAQRGRAYMVKLSRKAARVRRAATLLKRTKKA